MVEVQHQSFVTSSTEWSWMFTRLQNGDECSTSIPGSFNLRPETREPL